MFLMNSMLLVFPSAFSVNKISSLQSNVKEALEANGINCKNIFVEDSLVIADVDDAISAASVAKDLFGVEKVAVANRTGNKFNELVSALVDTGKKIIHRGDTFSVKVITKGTQYVGRDVEFATTASLMGELSGIDAKVVNENGSKLLYAYASRDTAYVCMFIDKGVGGLPTCSQNETVLCSVYDDLSALSCLLIIKNGFIPRIVLLKGEDNVRVAARNLDVIARKLGKKRLKIEMATVDIPSSDLRSLLMEKLSAIILAKLAAQYKIGFVALPLTASHPPRFVSELVQVVAKTAAPMLPLMFMDDLGSAAHVLGLDGLIDSSVTNFDQLYAKLKTVDINDIAVRAIESARSIDLEVGPNYLHDVIDSVTI
jgi:hypothetical protein